MPFAATPDGSNQARRTGSTELKRVARVGHRRIVATAMAVAVASAAVLSCEYLESNEPTCYQWDGSGTCLEYTDNGFIRSEDGRQIESVAESRVSNPTATPGTAPAATREVEPTNTPVPPTPTPATLQPTASPAATQTPAPEIKPTATPIAAPIFATFAVTRLTSDQADYAEPTWSPDGTKVAYSAKEPGNSYWDIFVLDTYGPSVTQLTDLRYSSTSPAWSPHGATMSFSYDSSGNGKRVIYVMDADGNNQTLISDTRALDPHDPMWSPDGTKIAFSSDRLGDDVWDIFVMDANGFNITSFAHGGAQAINPAWSPDGSKFAFSSDRLGDGTWDIFVMNADGSNVTRITDDRANAFNPRWSPDGSWIAFQSNRDGTWDIYVIRADGSELTQITRTEGDSGAKHPAWAPDGSSIVFVAVEERYSDIYLANVESLGIVASLRVPPRPGTFRSTQVTHTDGGLGAARWSPDGSRITFQSLHDGATDIYVVSLDGSGLAQITRTEGDSGAKNPDWSPDGNRIAFNSDRDGTSDIYVMNRDGSELTQITRTEGDSGAWWPDWSPDGNRIAFHSNRDGTHDIYVVNPDGSDLTQITHTEGDSSAQHPYWSPDGSRIAFLFDSDGTGNLYVMNHDGSDPRPITRVDEGRSIWRPQWAPDGSRIAFQSDHDGTWDIYVVNPDGSDLTQITHTEDGQSTVNPQWAPDGSRIAFQSDRDGTWDIYVVKPDGSELTQITRTVGNGGAGWAEWSPDGTRIVFDSNSDGAIEIYVVDVRSLGLGAAQTFVQPANPRDREVLIEFYEATNGDEWIDNSGWLSDEPLNQWRGVSIQDGRVTGISLAANRLTGEIAPTIGDLTSLRLLDLSANLLTGELPADSLRNLHELETLLLTENYLSGCVPESLRNTPVSDIIFTSLRYCDEPEPSTPKPMPTTPSFIEWNVGESVRESEERAARLGVQWLHRYAQQNGWTTTNEDLTVYIDTTDQLVDTCEQRLLLSPAFLPQCDDLRREDSGGLSPAWVSAEPEANFIKTTEPNETPSLARLHEIARQAIRQNIRTSFQHQARGASADPSPSWFTEGMVTYFTTVIANLHISASRHDGQSWLQEQRSGWIEVAKRERDDPLANSATDDGCAYECGPLAVELLASVVGVERIAYFHVALRRTIQEFFTGTVPEGIIRWPGHPDDWHHAFEETFGISVAYFHALYDQHRADQFPELDPPDSAP